MPVYLPYVLLMAVFLPFVGAVLILLTGEKRPNLREFWTISTAIVTFVAVSLLVPYVLQGHTLEYGMVKIYHGLELKLKADSFGLIFASLSSFLWIIVSFYTMGYMRSLQEHKQTRFYAAFALAIGGAIGVALSSNLLTLYMFYEILTISTYPLVAHEESHEARKAGRKYLAYLLVGAAFVLVSMAALYLFTGSLDFSPGGYVKVDTNSTFFRLIFVSFIIGFGTKAAIMPLHEWLPSAMVAPTPVSALLHAVAVVKAGVFCVLRVILYVYSPETLKTLDVWFIFALIVSATIIGANIIAITEDNLKRRLAFSTVNNLSVTILGGLLSSPLSSVGAMLHMVFHGFMKITLFMCAGAIFVQERKEKVSEMDGLGARMPYTMAAFTVGALGLIGIPPVAGFISKWFLCLGAIEAKSLGFMLVFLLSTLLDAVYFLPIIYLAFFKKSPGERKKTREAPLLLLMPIVFVALCSLLLFFFPDFLLHLQELATDAGESIFGGGRR